MLVNKREQKFSDKVPAWHDEADQNVQIDIDSKSRLRKLKATEAETTVSGTEYQQRLQAFYEEKINGHAMFDWAKP